MKKDTRVFASVGMDLGDEVAYYVCLDEKGEPRERGQVKMTPAAMRKTFGSMGRTRIAIEAGAQSRWVSGELKALGHAVIVANPRQVKLISASTRKSDPADALRGLAKTFGIRLPRITSERYAERALAQLPERLRERLAGLLGAVIALTEQAEAYDEQIEAIARERYPETARLAEVPGVGTLTAVSFALTIAEPGRFARSREVGGYVGLRPRQQQSGARIPQLGITKAGDRYVRTLLVQSRIACCGVAHPIRRSKRWGLKLCERGGANAKKRAVVAVARKLAVLLHKLWVSETRYVAFPAAA